MTYMLNGSATTIQIPTYNVFTGSSDIPAQSPSGTVLTLEDSQTNYTDSTSGMGQTAPTTDGSDAGYASRTKDFFASITLSQATTFGGGGNPLVPFTVNSSCIVAGTTYYFSLFAFGSHQYVESDVATSGSVTGHLKVTVNPFPGNTTAFEVLSH